MAEGEAGWCDLLMRVRGVAAVRVLGVQVIDDVGAHPVIVAEPKVAVAGPSAIAGTLRSHRSWGCMLHAMHAVAPRHAQMVRCMRR